MRLTLSVPSSDTAPDTLRRSEPVPSISTSKTSLDASVRSLAGVVVTACDPPGAMTASACIVGPLLLTLNSAGSLAAWSSMTVPAMKPLAVCAWPMSNARASTAKVWLPDGDASAGGGVHCCQPSGRLACGTWPGCWASASAGS